MVIETHSNINH